MLFKRIAVLAENYDLIDSLLSYVTLLFPKAEYHVVTIVDYSYEIMSVTPFIEESLEKSATRALFHCLDKLKEMGIEAKKGYYKGNFEAIMERYVKGRNIDLVAVGTSMEEDKKKSHISWHLSKLFKTSSKAILALDRTPQLRLPEKVFVPVGDAPNSKNAVLTAFDLCKEFGCSLALSYVGKKEVGTIYSHLKEMASDAEVPLSIVECDWKDSTQVIDCLEEYDLLVMGMGGHRLRDYARMAVRALPLTKMEMNILLYAPIPMLLVGGS